MVFFNQPIRTNAVNVLIIGSDSTHSNTAAASLSQLPPFLTVRTLSSCHTSSAKVCACAVSHSAASADILSDAVKRMVLLFVLSWQPPNYWK
ncbi:hypothetical protein BaRGS_00024734 [Batillaria attramentaria]|uniref:Uncharacterized protein n=1 Tax=Batillaria attramentaria TaxID=370345 RepID=A0ABD0KA52_9CAEN